MSIYAMYRDITKPNNSFHILLSSSCYRKGDILSYGTGNIIVSRDYKVTWWKKLFRRFGFKFKCFDPSGCWLKVKPINK